MKLDERTTHIYRVRTPRFYPSFFRTFFTFLKKLRNARMVLRCDLFVPLIPFFIPVERGIIDMPRTRDRGPHFFELPSEQKPSGVAMCFLNITICCDLRFLVRLSLYISVPFFFYYLSSILCNLIAKYVHNSNDLLPIYC